MPAVRVGLCWFKINSSCSCGNLNRLKALCNADFAFAVQVVQDDFIFFIDCVFKQCYFTVFR